MTTHFVPNTSDEQNSDSDKIVCPTKPNSFAQIRLVNFGHSSILAYSDSQSCALLIFIESRGSNYLIIIASIISFGVRGETDETTSVQIAKRCQNECAQLVHMFISSTEGGTEDAKE